MGEIQQQIRQVLAQHGRLVTDASELDSDADLYQAGLTSHASVNVMLALEDTFDIEFPDADLTKSTFGSIANIAAVVERLQAS